MLDFLKHSQLGVMPALSKEDQYQKGHQLCLFFGVVGVCVFGVARVFSGHSSGWEQETRTRGPPA